MTDFHPHSISQDDLMRLRHAAEAAWSDDTRHPDYEGHPNPSAGQCYVTSRWAADKLGGWHVATKNGHYFAMSPDKRYVVDLTGDWFSIAPHDQRFHGVKLDDEDEGWIPTEDQKRWQSGPVLYKQADHPLYQGARVKTFKTEHPRYQIFKERADAAYG
jgi:hypothetical protein